MFKINLAVWKLMARCTAILFAVIAADFLKLKINWAIILFAFIVVTVLFFSDANRKNR